MVRIDSVPLGVQRGGTIDNIADLGAFYEVVGWMPMDFDDEQSKIMIRTKSALDEVYVNFTERPDVAEALKNADFLNSGFKIYIQKSVEYSCIYAVQQNFGLSSIDQTLAVSAHGNFQIRRVGQPDSAIQKWPDSTFAARQS